MWKAEKSMNNLENIGRSEWERLINEWIFDENHREMLKRNLLDGLPYGKIAENYNYSYRQVARIIPKLKNQIFKKAK